ncbi:MAG: tRNA lysidine(34) synthetase TilS [Clostridium argentinense]|uniref:tRNA(Ile)-lysidine synthase n=1 Tax=Clostridium faecium TaxID=2762223 RepID=A0ABR8YW74_9CLOT|nr:tRNA lysidine(34) synthetase TilS [Clostridium faecium]MBD8048543.1 tRNA lysidine(34) synthetase TilS [Clostridium faecium]MBS5824025.1 tRNA lysidine(34) synthetase TilS [Clostridium argentinense]
MKDKVLRTIAENNMVDNGDRIIIALSGGPDSITLLHILHTLRNKLNITIYAAHVNHLLRGEDAYKDEENCKKYCEKLGIPCFIKRVDINELAKMKNVSHELAGREARYAFFQELMEKHNCNKIAIAHNLNDQAETILMRMMRGAGIEGLIGIRPVRDDIFIRPLIEITRKEIEEYCERNNLPAAIDKTNFENIYARNKIRLELIPYMENNFNKDIIHTLNRMSNIIKEDNEYLEEVSDEIFKKYYYRKDDRVIIYKGAFKEHKAIVTRVLRKAIFQIKGDLCNIENSHIIDIIKLYNQNTGKTIMLPDGLMVDNVYKDIHIYKETKNQNIDFYEKIPVDGDFYCEKLQVKIVTKVFSRNNDINLKSSEMVKYFDFDKVKDNIILRYRKDGDRFTSLGMKGSKKLKDLFIDFKIPRHERDTIPLICFGNEIGWIVGYRISDKFKIDNNTKTILQICMER